MIRLQGIFDFSRNVVVMLCPSPSGSVKPRQLRCLICKKQLKPAYVCLGFNLFGERWNMWEGEIYLILIYIYIYIQYLIWLSNQILIATCWNSDNIFRSGEQWCMQPDHQEDQSHWVLRQIPWKCRKGPGECFGTTPCTLSTRLEHEPIVSNPIFFTFHVIPCPMSLHAPCHSMSTHIIPCDSMPQYSKNPFIRLANTSA